MKINSVLQNIYTKRTLKKIETKFNYLWREKDFNMNTFLNTKLILMVLLFLTATFLLKHGYIIGPVITIVFYFLYDYLLLDVKIKKRADLLEHDAIFFFEVFALTMQSEKNIKICLEITSNAIDSSLSDEVKYALKETNLGKSLTEALENMINRIPSKTVDNVILNLIETNEYGNSLQGTLENQIDYITDKRILSIKERINKMPTKISIVSVLFFIPIMALLILGPIVISYFFS